MFSDTHCHLASYRYSAEELPALISRALDAGIHRQITLATGMDDLEPSLALCDQFDSVYACLGIHPCDVMEAPDNAISHLRPLLGHPKVVAIGETGLDYYHPAPDGHSEEEYHERQRSFLRQHFQLAQDHGLNICLHTRDRSGEASFNDCLEIYREFASSVRAVFHCFPGTEEQAQLIFELGGLVSFTGNVTFKSAKQIQATAQAIPLDSFMLETDSPYLAPTPHRGQRNEPAYIADIAKYIADLRDISRTELASATEHTANQFFKNFT